jgi:hypothetical protein
MKEGYTGKGLRGAPERWKSHGMLNLSTMRWDNRLITAQSECNQRSPRRFQFPIPLGLNLLLMPGEHVLRRDVADRAVQADVVVML